MTTEREFVLNNFFDKIFDEHELSDIEKISDLKMMYKTICENTSDERDNENFIGKDNINQFVQIDFKDIGRISEIGDTLFVFDNKLQSEHTLIGEDMIKFKQWFERKRGGK